jgi:acetyl-CoA synthetase
MSRCRPGRDHWWHELMETASGRVSGRILGRRASAISALHLRHHRKAQRHSAHHRRLLGRLLHHGQMDFRSARRRHLWCSADIGWVTGHTYVVYGMLQNGASVVMYEGGPTWPEPDRFWRIIDKYKVSIFYTAPTSIRAFMRLGEQWPRKHSLARCGCWAA